MFAAGILAIMMLGCLVAYGIGILVFHIAVANAVSHLLSEGKRFATWPVVGGILAVFFCMLGFSWSSISSIKLTPIALLVIVPALLIGFALFAPVIASLTLIRAESATWQNVRNTGSICTLAAIAFFVLAWVRTVFIP